MNSVVDDRISRHRITVDEFYRMAEVGLLPADARVELIDGEVIDLAPVGSKHAAIVDALTTVLGKCVGERAIVAVQRPVRLNQRSEPQPDLALLLPRADFYVAKHPGPPDVLLVIEVCDTTLRYDREIKLPLYAQHAIPEVWLIDIGGRQLDRCLHPVNGAYGDITHHDSGSIEASLLPGSTVDLGFVLGLLD